MLEFFLQAISIFSFKHNKPGRVRHTRAELKEPLNIAAERDIVPSGLLKPSSWNTRTKLRNVAYLMFSIVAGSGGWGNGHWFLFGDLQPRSPIRTFARDSDHFPGGFPFPGAVSSPADAMDLLLGLTIRFIVASSFLGVIGWRDYRSRWLGALIRQQALSNLGQYIFGLRHRWSYYGRR